MSVEVNLQESLVVENKTEATKQLLKEVADYFINNWGISRLILTVDGHTYETEEWELAKDSELYGILQKLDTYSCVSYLLIACNRGSISWRQEAAFMHLFTDGSELRRFVKYKCLEYYDQDDGIVTYAFDDSHNGFIPWNSSKEDVSDVEKWFSYNFSILVETEDVDLTEGEIGAYLEGFINRLQAFEENIEADLDADILEAYHNVSLSGKEIDEFAKLLGEFAAFCESHGLDCQITAPFVAEDADYKFAALQITPTVEEPNFRYCRF